MKVYYLTRDVYEGVIGFTHGFAMKQNLIYIPKPKEAIIAQNPQDKDEFFYLTDKGVLKQARDIAKGKESLKGPLKRIEIKDSRIEEIIKLGKDVINSKNQFKDKIKSLEIFEL